MGRSENIVGGGGMMPPMGPMGMMGPMGPMAPMDRAGGGPAPARFRPGQVMSGMIVRFNAAKGYGFLVPDDLDEDIFFLRSEMPQEIQAAQSQQEVANTRVEFEVRTMPDGKMRAQRMLLMQDQPPPGNRKTRESAENLPPLDASLVDE